MHSDAAPVHVAFYGTLMSAFDSLDALDVRRRLYLLGPCRIGGRLFDMGEWPTLVLGGGVVHGELFEILDPGVFATLDPFEDCDPEDSGASSYLRVRVTLLEPAVEAWLYVANHPVAAEREILCGSWREWVGSSGAGR